MKTKKTIILSKIIYILFILFLTYNLVFLISTTITSREYVKIFKYSFSNVQDKILEPVLKKNDFIVTKKVSQSDLNIGDMIFYYFNDSMKISRIFNIKSENGKTTYITKGEQNNYPNIEQIQASQIEGKVITRIPLLGFITRILESKITSIVLLGLLLLRYSYNNYLYKYKMERKRKKRKETDRFYQS